MSIVKKSRVHELSIDFLAYLIGSGLYAVAVNTFSAPNNIAPGGVTGLSIIINYVTQAPIGTVMFLLNIPLFLLGIYFIGWKFIAKTVVATFMMSIIIDVTAPFIPAYQGDMILAALFGGVLEGLGLGLVFLRGATTGGSDLAARLLALKFPHLSLGRLMLSVDAIVILVAALVFQNVESVLYAVVMLFVSSRVVDGLLYGADRGKMILVVSRKSGEIAKEILDQLERGVTLLQGKGAYTGEGQEVLLCAVRRHEAVKLHNIVRSADPDAFWIVTEAGEIMGEGFKQLKAPDRKKRRNKT